MSRSLHRLVVLLVSLSLSLSFWLSPAPTVAQEAPPTQCFPETGHCLEGRFLAYWQEHGGLAVFGYPLTPARWEPNPDAQTAAIQPVVWSQWFERARFEYHPGNPAPYDVLLGRLGHDRLLQQGRDWFSAFPHGTPRDGCHWFDTNHGLCDQAPTGETTGFRSYFSRHGLGDPALDAFANSVALFGLPLSEPQLEKNTSGDTVLTQWFERGRFEYHPKNPAATRVLLGRLGAEVLEQRPARPAAIDGVRTQELSPTSVGVQVAYDVAGSARLTAIAQGADGTVLATSEAVAATADEHAAALSLTWPDAGARAATASLKLCLTASAGGDLTCLAVPAQPAFSSFSQGPVGPASPFRNTCRITRDGFRALLSRSAAQPVLAERDAGAYWDTIVAHKIDPLFIAAIFKHESQMGRYGTATKTRSWGNTRNPSFGATPIGQVAGRSGTFPVFASWHDGATSTVARLNASNWVYAKRQMISEVFIHPSGQVWAPAGDMNNPNGYLRAVLDFMNRHQEPTGGACR